jgi:hypothetical protein
VQPGKKKCLENIPKKEFPKIKACKFFNAISQLKYEGMPKLMIALTS